MARQSLERGGEAFRVIDKEMRFYHCECGDDASSLSELRCIKDPKAECKGSGYYGENGDQLCPLARHKEWRKLIASLSKDSV